MYNDVEVAAVLRNHRPVDFDEAFSIYEVNQAHFYDATERPATAGLGGFPNHLLVTSPRRVKLRLRRASPALRKVDGTAYRTGTDRRRPRCRRVRARRCGRGAPSGVPTVPEDLDEPKLPGPGSSVSGRSRAGRRSREVDACLHDGARRFSIVSDKPKPLVVTLSAVSLDEGQLVFVDTTAAESAAASDPHRAEAAR